MKTLVAFFSHAGENYFDGGYKNLKVGNAKVIADKVQKFTGADEFEIETIKKYPIGYKACCDEAMREKKSNELPELKIDLPTDEYDHIILVYPCWWGTMPQAVFSFLSLHNFSNKTISPICTHEGSGMGSSESDLKRVCSKSTITRGLAIQGSLAQTSDAAIKSWLKQNGLL